MGEPEQRFWLSSSEPFWLIQAHTPTGKYTLELELDELREMCFWALRTFKGTSWPVATITTRDPNEN